MATTYTPEHLRKLFHEAFDLGLWYDFLLHFFNATELKKTPEKILGNTLDEGYYLGCIDTTDSYRIGLFHYEIAKGSVANKRTGLRHLVRSFINPTWGEFDAALVVFNSGDHWRLSFICDIKGEETSPKRYTYVFGSDDQLYKTPVERFTLLKKKGISFEHLREAFSVEALSKEFFDNYRQHYGDFVAYITGKRYIKRTKGWVEEQIHEPHPQLQTQFAGDEKRVRDYIKKLLGRIVFLYYLQRKGWLGVPQDKDWGEGDLDFMRHLFEYASQAQKADFVEAVLEPLFYGALNTDRSKSGDLFDTQVHFPNSGTALRIPYLNGGLFEADENDQLTVTFPAEYFQRLLDFFSQYNFTIDENDPSDAQVGVDPEMLGRIFESLLEDNKEKGAYYTPKEIVQYMCRESLTAYLRTDIDPEKEQEQSEAIARFVKSGNDEDLCGYTASGGQYDLRTEVLNKLKEVKICDPAIGSGAFPMGLLRELYHCRIALEEASISPAEIKSQIIKNNIYGVDIERGAVDIARLRFWLSLVVDEETPQPLPNLDYKIMQGNSLLESYQGVDLSTLTQRKQEGDICLFDDMADVYRRKLRQAVSAYYSETNHEHKEKLHQDISEAIEAQLTEQCYQVDFSGIDLSANTHFFLWHTWFDDVFNRPSGRNGFDIVIGNPPWGAKLLDSDKPIYKRSYESAKTKKGEQKGSLDTFSLFIELGYTIALHAGVCAFIVPLSITSSSAMEGLHKLLLSGCGDIYISSFGDRPRRVFESAEQQVSIILFQKQPAVEPRVHTTAINKRRASQSINAMIRDLAFVHVCRSYIRNGRIPKIGTQLEHNLLSKLYNNAVGSIEKYTTPQGRPIYYRKAGGRYYKIITLTPTGSSAEGEIIVEKNLQKAIAAIMSSSLYYWYWLIHSDWHNMRSLEVSWFPLPTLTEDNIAHLENLYDAYSDDLHNNIKVTATGLVCYFARKSKKLIDKIDDYIGPLYGFTIEEIEFIKNYEIEFRISDEE